MKNLFLATALLVGIVATAQTDRTSARKTKERTEQTSPENRIENRVAKMTKELNLTPKQQTDLKAVMLESQKENMAKREDRKKATEQRKATMQAKRKIHDDKISAILNADQNAKWQQMKTENENKRTEKMKTMKTERKQKNK